MPRAAEKAVLGSILIDNALLGKARTMRLSPKDFDVTEHKVAYRAMRDMADEDLAIDSVSLADFLEQRGSLTSAGGPEYIHTLDTALPDIANFDTYVKSVRASSVRSLVLRQAMRMKKLASENVDLDGLIGESSKILNEIIEEAESGVSRSVDLSTSISGVISGLRTGKSNAIPTGYDYLDDKLVGGLLPGGFYVVAGRPGMGKTAFCTNVCCYAAEAEQRNVAIFSLEMGAEELGARILATEAQIPLTKMRQRAMSPDEWHQLDMAQKTLRNFSIEIDDSGSVYVINGIVSRARALKARGKLDLLCVDYIQLIESSHGSRNRVEEVSIISRKMKKLAKELNIPVIGISQLTRAVDKRADRRPLLSDLRESGSIEQDADVVLFVFRPGHYKPVDDTHGKTEIIIAKNRQGEGGTVYLQWKGEFTEFVEPGVLANFGKS